MQVSSYLQYVEDILLDISGGTPTSSPEINTIKVEMAFELSRAFFFLGKYDSTLKYGELCGSFPDNERILGR